jgi:Uma2 family endonuclease
MSAVASTHPTVLPAMPSGVHRITVDEYERMAGALNDDRVELIDGYLVTKMGKKPPHVWSVDCLDELFRALLIGAALCVRKENPLRIVEFDEPEPDVVIARGRRATYRARHPEPKDVALVIEVSETTYDRDRGHKWVTYAKSGIPVYWIVNIVNPAQMRIEVYTDPGPDGYRSRVDFKSGDQIPVVIDGKQFPPIAVDDILP